jgi:hypothetical protein
VQLEQRLHKKWQHWYLEHGQAHQHAASDTLLRHSRQLLWQFHYHYSNSVQISWWYAHMYSHKWMKEALSVAECPQYAL